MLDRIAEWMRQADYDMETAEFMFRGGRRFYTVFMCHLSLEKALKALFEAKLGELAPKTHNLKLLLTRIALDPRPDIGRFLVELNEAGVTTRYPSDLSRLQAQYSEEVVGQIMLKSKDALRWIKTQLPNR